MRRGALLLLVIVSALGQVRQRVRPPEGITCSPNDLTAYFGRVTAYNRTDTTLKLTLRTDEETTERFNLKLPLKMRLSGADFKADDWQAVEASKGKAKPGMRATVWQCKGGDHQIDW